MVLSVRPVCAPFYFCPGCRHLCLDEGRAAGERPVPPQETVLLHGWRSYRPFWRNQVRFLHFLSITFDRSHMVLSQFQSADVVMKSNTGFVSFIQQLYLTGNNNFRSFLVISPCLLSLNRRLFSF